jgi:hypothetical protein
VGCQGDERTWPLRPSPSLDVRLYQRGMIT